MKLLNTFLNVYCELVNGFFFKSLFTISVISCRYRKYVANDSWSAVPGLHSDLSQEPFLDIAVGGHEIPNGDPDELQVNLLVIIML